MGHYDEYHEQRENEQRKRETERREKLEQEHPQRVERAKQFAQMMEDYEWYFGTRIS